MKINRRGGREDMHANRVRRSSAVHRARRTRLGRRSGAEPEPRNKAATARAKKQNFPASHTKTPTAGNIIFRKVRKRESG